MPSSRSFQRFLIVIVLFGATTGQSRQTQRQQQQKQQQRQRQEEQSQARDYHYEFAPLHLLSKQKDYAQFLLPNDFIHSSLSFSENQYGASSNPKHQIPIQIQHFQKGNGNSLAAREIAVEILGENFSPNTVDNSDDDDDVGEYISLDFLGKEHNSNFRRSNDEFTLKTEQQLRTDKKRQEMTFKNYDWEENALADMDINGNDDDKDSKDNLLANAKWSATDDMYNIAESFLNMNSDDEKATSSKLNVDFDVDESDSDVKDMKSLLHDINMNMMDEITYQPIYNQEENDTENILRESLTKRNPLAVGDHGNMFLHPHYPYAYYKMGTRAGDKRNNAANHVTLRNNNKREKIRPQRTTFIPSVSTGSMTHLGHFFNDLSHNVRFSERNRLLKPQEKLLQGDHPLRMLQNDVDDESNEQAKIEKTAEFLHAIRSYRPSQKIRSLVSMNPQGYHGSNFLDPNYMWVGLG